MIIKFFRNTYKKKVKALLEGLEIEEVEKFMSVAKTGDYRNLGKIYVKEVKKRIGLYT